MLAKATRSTPHPFGSVRSTGDSRVTLAVCVPATAVAALGDRKAVNQPPLNFCACQSMIITKAPRGLDAAPLPK